MNQNKAIVTIWRLELADPLPGQYVTLALTLG
jgi:hypothetical protein